MISFESFSFFSREIIFDISLTFVMTAITSPVSSNTGLPVMRTFFPEISFSVTVIDFFDFITSSVICTFIMPEFMSSDMDLPMYSDLLWPVSFS